MKIGLVCPYDLWGGGGVQECVLALQKELASFGHEVKIITPQPRSRKEPIPPFVLTVGISTNINIFSATQTQFSASVDTEAINKLLEEEDFDLLHFHEPSVPILNRQLLARSTCLNVATCHAAIPDDMMSKAIINMFNAYTKGLIKYIGSFSAVSEPAAKYIRGFTKDTISIIPNGIDLTKYKLQEDENVSAEKKHIDSKSPKTILYIGRLEKRKGVKYLLKAFREFAKTNENVNLKLIGDGPDRNKLQEWVKKYKVPRVEFLGFVSDDRKRKLLASADLFCSPALYGESFGIVLLEAMAMGIVTVAGDNPGYASVMKGDGRISLVDPTDKYTFVERINTLLYDDDVRQAWQAWAKEYVKQFDYHKVAKQYESFYNEALNN